MNSYHQIQPGWVLHRGSSLCKVLETQPHLYFLIQFAKIKHTFSLKYWLLKIVWTPAHQVWLRIKIISISSILQELAVFKGLCSWSRKSSSMSNDHCSHLWYCGPIFYIQLHGILPNHISWCLTSINHQTLLGAIFNRTLFG